MEWLKEILGEELFKQVVEKLGDKKVLLNDGNYLPKSKFDEKNEEVKLLKEKVSTLEKQGKDTVKLLKDNEELKGKYETLQSSSKTQLETKDKEIKEVITKGLLKDSLAEMGAVYPELLIKNINLDDVIVQDNKILNNDILKSLKDNYKDLFKDTRVTGNNTNQNQNQNNDTGIKNPFAKESWNMTEQVKLYNTDRQLYERLKNTK